MSQQSKNDYDQAMLEAYDVSDGLRGKYAGCFADGAQVVVLDPDVAEETP